MCGDKLWALADYALQLADGLRCLFFCEQLACPVHFGIEPAGLLQPETGSGDRERPKEDDGYASNEIICLRSDFGNECSKKQTSCQTADVCGVVCDARDCPEDEVVGQKPQEATELARYQRTRR